MIVEFSIKGGELSKLKTGCVLVGVFDSKKLSSPGAALDAASKGAKLVKQLYTFSSEATCHQGYTSFRENIVNFSNLHTRPRGQGHSLFHG